MGRVRVPGADCARALDVLGGVQRFGLGALLGGRGCGIDHAEAHRLRFHVGILVTAGEWGHMVDFAEVPVAAGDLLLLRAGQVHAFARGGRKEGEIVTLTREMAGWLERFPGVGECVERLWERGPRVRLTEESGRCVGEWYAEFGRELGLRGRAGMEGRVSYALGLLLSRMASLPEFGEAGEGGERPSRVARAFAGLLEEHFVTQREPAWYAARLHVSVRTLDRHLVRYGKHTAKESITARVLLEAKRLLADPEQQVKGVADRLRFEEAANFSRFFRNNAGVSPSDFRERMPEWRA